MRLWSLAPRYLDVKGLLAVWREGLLARAVLLGQTHGYLNHPQLERFKNQVDPIAAINYYLEIVANEATSRGYHFNANKITCGLQPPLILVNEGQVKWDSAPGQAVSLSAIRLPASSHNAPSSVGGTGARALTPLARPSREVWLWKGCPTPD